jgi:hypothetical protein
MYTFSFSEKLDHNYVPFTVRQTTNAIRRAKNSTATGSDGLTALHLKHIGPCGIAYMTKLFNLSLSHSNLPAIWKTANIIPILKPGKPLTLAPPTDPSLCFSLSSKLWRVLSFPSFVQVCQYPALSMVLLPAVLLLLPCCLLSPWPLTALIKTSLQLALLSSLWISPMSLMQ